jgi:hypothetical protein
MEMIHFNNNISMNKKNQILKENKDISFFEHLIFFNLDKITYILSLINKLTKLQF